MRELAVGRSRIELTQGDITKVRVDAIVNAANENLYHGGGVAAAISRAGGPVIDQESEKVAPCPTGGAVVTSGGRLPARFVIHAVGPIWKNGSKGEPELLASAYRSSLERATELGIRSVAFPSISTGIYGYPIEQAARVALGAVREYLESHPGGALEQVLFVLFREADLRVFEAALTGIAEGASS
jgi:O-acetyl-ADP-ribose deacetylase